MTATANQLLVEAKEAVAPDHAAITSSSPTWAPPRAPLPPHRLAAIANALGISTPSPATRPSASIVSASSSYPGTPASSYDHNWRSPTPSSSSTHNFSSYSQPNSRFLLHILPPLHLPHETNSASDCSELTPPPSNASGYHTQFRRGTLVPLHSTLQLQKAAIAKEYALPSTAGMILYLSSASSTQPSPVPSVTNINEPDTEEPGPRLSDDIWKHVWTRVLKAEREENLAASRSPTPNFGLGLNVGLKNSPYLSHDVHGPLRPMFTHNSHERNAQLSQSSIFPITPSPSSPSSTSDVRSHPKSTAHSLSSRSPSQDTAETSSGSFADELETDPHTEKLHLPGLKSQSIIPILAKVEFDIDRRKAAWYEPWLRSRRMNQLKRSESRKGQLSNEKTAPIRLKLASKVEKRGLQPFLESPEQELDDLLEKKTSKKVPPPLILPPIGDDPDDGGEVHLAYLMSDSGDIGVFDDYEGLGEFSYDPYDPHDRRKSQFIMKTKLDEIEKTLAQFSPKHLDQNNFQTEAPNQRSPATSRSVNGSPLKQDDGTSSSNEDRSWPDRSTSLKAKHHTVRYENAQVNTQGKAKLNEEEVPYTPGWSEQPMAKPAEKTPTSALRKKQYRNTFKLEGSTVIPRDSAEAEAAYPPFRVSSRSISGASNSARSMNPPSPPRLAVNGVSPSASVSYMAKNSSDFDKVLASGTTIRKRDHEEEKRSRALITPERQGSSPVIPLSPDPFGRFAYKPAASSRGFTPYPDPGPSKVEDGTSASSSRFSADSVTAEGDKGAAPLVSVKSVKKLWRKSKKLSISGPQSISAPLSNPPPLPGSSQDHLDWPPTPLSPLPPPAPSPSQLVKHSRVDSAYDHFHFDQESPYPVRKSSSIKTSQRSISERPPSPSQPAAPAKDRSSIRKSILKGWKPPVAETQSQGGMLEPRSSAERRPSGERPHPNANEAVGMRQRRPSVLDVAASMRASASSPDNPPNRQVPQVQYVQNGRVAGLSERRKSRPTVIPTPSSMDMPHYSPVPVPSPLLPSSSPPRSLMSENNRPSFDSSQFEMVSPMVNNSLSYPYHALDHNGL